MRCFIAINLPKEVKDHLYETENKLASGRFAKVKWTHKKNLHLTLKFLGEINDSQVEIIKHKLDSIQCQMFNLKLGQIGFFPDNLKPRVIWVGVEPPAKAMELQQEIDTALREDFSPEQKFHAHITLGRVKFIKKRVEFMEHIKNVKIKPLKFDVKSFELMESHLRREGPGYKMLKEFPLQDE